MDVPNPGEKDTRLDTDLERPWFISLGRTVCADDRLLADGEEAAVSKAVAKGAEGDIVKLEEGGNIVVDDSSDKIASVDWPLKTLSSTAPVGASLTPTFPAAMSAILPSESRRMSGLALRAKSCSRE